MISVAQDIALINSHAYKRELFVLGYDSKLKINELVNYSNTIIQ